MTTAFDAAEASDSRTPVTLIKLYLDRCDLVFAQAPCVATGEPCYNTYRTCKDVGNYSLNRDLPLNIHTVNVTPPVPGSRSYLQGVNISAAEIKPDKTATGRLTFKVVDDVDGDVGVDPYVSQRAEVPSTSFWGKLKARNPNYVGRVVEVWQGYIDEEAGFAGTDPADLSLRWYGTLTKFARGGRVWEFEAVDPLKNLDNIEVPAPVDVTLAAPIDDADLSVTVSDESEILDAPNYILIEDEILFYTAINRLSGVLTIDPDGRGIDGTAAVPHDVGAEIGRVRLYSGNPWDIQKNQMLLGDAAYPPAVVDSAAFDQWRDFGSGEPDYTRFVTEPTKLSELFFSLCTALNSWAWYDEGQQITTRRAISNQPGRDYLRWTQVGNIVDGDVSIEDDPTTRKSIVVVYWDLIPLGDPADPKDYLRKAISVDGEAVSENLFASESATFPVFLPWLSRRHIEEGAAKRHATAIGGRMLLGSRYPLSLLRFEVERKDGAVRTGNLVRLSTDAVLTASGHPVVDATFSVMRREAKGDNVLIKVLQAPSGRQAYFAPAGLPEYDEATPEQREYGFWSSADGRLPNSDDGYGYW